MDRNATPTLDERLEALFVQVRQAVVLTIVLLFVWTVAAVGSVGLMMAGLVPGSGPGMAILLFLGLLVPVQVVVLAGRNQREIRRRAREHVGAERDFPLGQIARRISPVRWLAVGPQAMTVVGPNLGIEISRERCAAVYTDGSEMWVQWRAADGATCSVWSTPGRRGGDVAAELARGYGWPVERVSEGQMAAARATGVARVRRAGAAGMLVPTLTMLATMVPSLVYVEVARTALRDRPVAFAMGVLGWSALCTCAFAAVAYWYALPAMAREEKRLWELPVEFTGKD